MAAERWAMQIAADAQRKGFAQLDPQWLQQWTAAIIEAVRENDRQQ